MTRPIVPSSSVPVSARNGGISTEYQQFFNALPGVGNVAPLAPVTLTASPFLYMASKTGVLLISGGTVSAVTLKRNTTTVATGMTAGALPVANGDVVKITYSVLPTVTFVPS